MTAIFEVELPDGNILEIEAPADTSPDVIKARARKHIIETKKAAAPVEQPKQGNPATAYLANQINDRANAVRAFGHNLANPFIGAARFAINKDAEYGGEMVGDMANRFNQWADKRESDYQAQVPNNLATGAGAVLGGAASTFALPQARVGQATGMIPKMGAGAANAMGFTALSNQAATGETGDMTLPAIIGGSIPLVGKGAVALAKGASDKIPQMTKGIIAKAQKAGIPIYPHQIMDSKAVKTLSSVLGSMPFSGAQGKIKAQNDAYTQFVSNLIGRNTKNITPQTLSLANKAKSEMYNASLDGVNIPVGKDVFSNILSARNKAGVSQETRQAFDEFADTLLDEVNRNGGRIPGRLYQELRRNLIESKSPAAREVRKILEANTEKNMPADRLALYKKANELNTNIKSVEKAMKGADTLNAKVATEGKVNPATFRNAVDPKYRPSKDLQAAAKIGQLIKDPIPYSGTFERGLIGTAAGTTGITALTNPAGLGALSSLMAGGAATGATAGRVINSPLLTRYLVGGMGKGAQKSARAFEKEAPRYAGPLAATQNNRKKDKK